MSNTLPRFELRNASNSRSQSTDVVAVYQDQQKKATAPKGAYGSSVEKLRKAEAFTAKCGSTQFLRFGGHGGAENAVLLGLGRPQDATEEDFRKAGGALWARLVAERVVHASVDVDVILGVAGLKSEHSEERLVRALAEGFLLPYQDLDEHKTAKKDAYTGPESVEWVCGKAGLRAKLQKELAEAQATAECVRITRAWSNQPSNVGTPEYFAAQAKKLAQKYKLKCRVLTEAECKREKMGLFIGVGQGSVRDARFVIVEYVPARAKKKVCLVGKGITFDSGGISIKPSLKMEDMKHDMTGAATVMGAAILASLWKSSNHVIAIMAFTENMPDGDAIAPGNILTARSGKTVEVINTDAEGRLILADALDYAQDMKPDYLVNIATLTGAVSVALGKQACAVLGNDEALIESVRSAGARNGERIWQLPLWDEYFEDMKSDYADMRNSANDGNGGTIRGAIFLKQFIREGQPWAHLDIAGTAYSIGHLSYIPKKGASGLWVRTLAQLAMDL